MQKLGMTLYYLRKFHSLYKIFGECCSLYREITIYEVRFNNVERHLEAWTKTVIYDKKWNDAWLSYRKVQQRQNLFMRCNANGIKAHSMIL